MNFFSQSYWNTSSIGNVDKNCAWGLPNSWIFYEYCDLRGRVVHWDNAFTYSQKILSSSSTGAWSDFETQLSESWTLVSKATFSSVAPKADIRAAKWENMRRLLSTFSLKLSSEWQVLNTGQPARNFHNPKKERGWKNLLYFKQILFLLIKFLVFM